MSEATSKTIGKAFALEEVPVSLEVPKHTALVRLPFISVGTGNTKIQLAMHTDSALTFIRTLNTFPDIDQLRIEGRVLNAGQKILLKQSSTYNFYLAGRLDRDRFILPSSCNFSLYEVAGLLRSPSSPASLKEDIGYQTGYFNAGELVRRWLSEGRPNDLLPIIGAINEFHIGSDTLSPQRLSVMATSLHQAFVKQEQSTQSRATIAKIPGFTNYSIQALFPKTVNVNETIKTYPTLADTDRIISYNSK